MIPEIGRYYRQLSGAKPFKVRNTLPARELARVQYLSGVRRTVPFDCIVEIDYPLFTGNWCPECHGKINASSRCTECGWSTADIENPNPNIEAHEGENTMANNNNNLYRLNEEGKDPVYVRRVGTDGSLAVVKEETSGALRAVDAKLLEEVLPYTVSVKFLAGGRSKAYAYLAEEGEFKAGDLLVSEGNSGYEPGFATVTAVNTKSRAATVRFSGWKVNATRVEAS